MMNKNILIFLPDVLRARGGGPSTFIYNLRTAFEKVSKDEIDSDTFVIKNYVVHFVHAGIKKDVANIKKNKTQFPRDFLNLPFKMIKKILENSPLIYFLFSLNFRMKKLILEKLDIIEKCKVLYCPDGFSIYYMKRYLKDNFENKIKLLQIHSPDDIVNELKKISEFYSTKNIFNKLFHHIFPFEKFSYINNLGIQSTNYFIYPCKEAIEVHLKANKEIKKFYDLSPDKFLYCPTGAPPLVVNKKREEIRKVLGFKESDFLVIFIGRHNEYKGFDILFEAIKNLRKNYKDIYLVSAGKGPLIEKFKKDKEAEKVWKYIGFVENVGDYINACDVHCIPNRESYFDIGLIESLSVGTPIITTNVGGHRFFKDKSKGIFLINPEMKELMDAIIKVKSFKETEREKLKEENKKLYQSNFTLEKFAQNFLEIIDTVLKENN